MGWVGHCGSRGFARVVLGFGGVLCVLRAVRGFKVWFGLELLVLGLLVLINTGGVLENEASMKYFMVQGLGSAWFFAGLSLVRGCSGFVGYLRSV